MARKFAAVVLSLGCLNASSALALGLGDIKLESYLNEPLKAQVNLLNTGTLHGDQIRIRLATKDDFEKLGVDRAYFLTSIRFEVQVDGNGRGRIILTSDDAVLEPYLDFIVEARWPSGRLLREYTVLVDPPVFDESAQVISATSRVIEVEGEQYLADDLKKKETESTVQRTGTHVDVRDSNLPPGQMPERDFGSEASGTPAPGARYMIRRDETLWEIAQQARPEGASVNQTMLDIQRLNPRAFIDGNINRIKAGYVVYLPAASDISSSDQSAAQATVRQQNEDWREGKSSSAYTSGGPSLRIAVDTTDAGEAETAATGDEVAAGDGSGGGEHQAGASAASMEDIEKAELESTEAQSRLSSMEQQVETLERIVSLKDEQIAALQNALTEAGQADAAAAVVEEISPLETPAESATDGTLLGEEDTDETVPGEEVSDESPAGEEALTDSEPELESLAELAGPEELEEAVDAVEAEEPDEQSVHQPDQSAAQPAPAPAAAKTAAEQDGGIMSYLFYGLGALVLAILGFLFLRRRGDSDDEALEMPARQDEGDVFADVELKDQALEVADVEALVEEDAVEEIEEPEEELELESGRDNRGYGERKHDEYASDVDTGDALAEADIYIAYGRYPQAIDLLKNASAAEPGNTTYMLKLMEIHAEMGDRDGLMQQLAELEKTGDTAALSRAEDLLAGVESRATSAPLEEPAPMEELAAAPVAAVPLEEPVDKLEPLEDSDFGGLEIEQPGGEAEQVADDLDLSADFDTEPQLAGGDEGEDLVIAAEANGMSTKLDLARAYLDMGDEDGARQILEEVVAEASDDLKAEARALLERIG